MAEYAAGFFLLADNLEGAVDVCLNQIKDMQLAVAVARVYEGDNGPVLRKVLQDEVLPLAAQGGNRWLASWAFWMLGRKDMAVRALIVRFIHFLLYYSTGVNFFFWLRLLFIPFSTHHPLRILSRVCF